MEECTFHCVTCASDKVFAVEQKNDVGQTIGIVFACENCLDKITGKAIQISIGDPVIDENEVMN